MALINFPSSPSLNDEYSFEGRTWVWNGSGWEMRSLAQPVLPPIAETDRVITANYEITNGYNGVSVGTVEVAEDVAVTVPENATWMVL
jgi:hypothetical protein